MNKTLAAIVLCLPLVAIGCGDEKTKSKSDPAVNEQADKPATEGSPAEEKTNHGTASFQGQTLSDMSVVAVVKLSKYTMFTLKKGRVTVMMTVPELVKGAYEAAKPGQGVALTLTGAGQPGKISIRAMRSAKIEIQKDGEIIEGSYSGLVAGGGEKPIEINGSFRFERKMIP